MDKKFIESVKKLNGTRIRDLIDYVSANGTDVSDEYDCYTLQSSFVPTGYVPAIDTVCVRVAQIDEYTILFTVRYENDVLMRADRKYNYHPLQREFKFHSSIKLDNITEYAPVIFEEQYQKWCKETADKIRNEIVVAHAYIEEYTEIQEIEKQIAAEQEEEQKKNSKEDLTSNYISTNENTFSDTFDATYNALKALHDKIFKNTEAEDTDDADDEPPYPKDCDKCSIKEDCDRLKKILPYDDEEDDEDDDIEDDEDEDDIDAFDVGEFIADYITPTLLMSLHQKLISSKGSQKTLTVDIAKSFMDDVFSNTNVCLRENRLIVNTSKPDSEFNGNYVLEVYDRKTREIRWKQVIDVSKLRPCDIDPYGGYADHTNIYENMDSILYRSIIFDALYDYMRRNIKYRELGEAVYDDKNPNNHKIEYWNENIELCPTIRGGKIK